MTPSQRAKYLIENNQLMTVATADALGKPWISTVGYSYDEDFNLYWVSHKDHLHSMNVKSRPQVGIVIFGPITPNDMDGVFFEAEALELENENDIKKGIEVMTKTSQPHKFTIKSKSNVSGDASWRIYRAKPIEITKRANGTDPKTGQAITIRQLVDLS